MGWPSTGTLSAPRAEAGTWGWHLGPAPGAGTGPGVGDGAAPRHRATGRWMGLPHPIHGTLDLQRCPSPGEGPGIFPRGAGASRCRGDVPGRLEAPGRVPSPWGLIGMGEGLLPERNRVLAPGRRVPVPGGHSFPGEGSQSQLGVSLGQGGSMLLQESQSQGGVPVPAGRIWVQGGPGTEGGPDPCWGVPDAAGAPFPRGASPCRGGLGAGWGCPSARAFPVPGGCVGGSVPGDSRCRRVPVLGSSRCRGVTTAELTGAWRSGAVLWRL